MGLLKKHKIAVLAVLLMFVCGAVVYGGNSTAEDTEKTTSAENDPWKNIGSQDGEYSVGDALYKMIVAVLVVVALGVAAMYGSKKVLPKFVQTQGKKIKIVETVHLGGRKTVHLLDIGGQQILIGCTNERITKLVDVIDVLTEKSFPLGGDEKSEGDE